MDNLLGIYCFIRNGVKYDYPFVESIESAIPIADQIVINECGSDDNTLEILQKLKEKYPDKIKIIRDEWVTHHSQLSQRGNACIPHLTTKWHWQLQADEVIHEKDYETIRKALTDALDKPIDAFKTHYYHFMANYETEFDFCYTKATRIARRGTNWWLCGDAAELSGFATAADALVVQRTQGTDYYKVSIDSSGYNLEFEIKDSSGTGYASADISDYLDLGVSDYPHYFAVSYVSGSVFFYADGTQIGTASITTPSSIPSLPLGTQSISTAIAEIGIDEILLSEGYLDENTAEENFLSTRPRITGTGIPSGSVERYHQAKFVFNCYIRGVHSGSIAKYLNPYYNYPYVLPLFKKL